MSQREYLKKNFVATRILVFGFEFFIGERYGILGNNAAIISIPS
jgi:hypothetical protein